MKPNAYSDDCPTRQILDRVGQAEFLFNVMGFLDDPEILARARRRVFLDIDPGFDEMAVGFGQAVVVGVPSEEAAEERLARLRSHD